MRRLTMSMAALAMAVSAFFASTDSASAAPPSDQVTCGATITADTTLRRDLVDCPGMGLEIGADHITLNLNGHTIDGNGTPATCGAVVPCDVGVANRDGHHHVTIKGGTIRQFGIGLLSANAASNQLKRLRISQSHELGVVADAASGTVIKHNVFDQNGTSGLVVMRSQRMLIKGNVVEGSRGFGLFTFDLEASRIEGNKLDKNDHGIAVFGDSRRNLVRANTVTRSGGSAIDLGQGAQNRVDGNRLADNGDGIILTDEQHTVVSNNHVTGTGLYGFPDTGGFGVILDGADANTVRHNHVVDGRGPAILVTKLDSPTGADDNAVVGNVARNSGSDGISIGAGTSGTKVRRNIAAGNGDDGIDVDAPATTVVKNTTRRNKDLGIEAVAGVRDGGGNRAYANGDPLQCTNIECRGVRQWSSN